MTLAVGITGLYGAFSIAGGIIGYVKARSTASLIAGTMSGALLLLCAAGMSQGRPVATWGSLAIAAALGARFLGTWLKTRRVMPDLIMVLFSAATIAAAAASLWPR